MICKFLILPFITVAIGCTSTPTVVEKTYWVNPSVKPQAKMFVNAETGKCMMVVPTTRFSCERFPIHDVQVIVRHYQKI